MIFADRLQDMLHFGGGALQDSVTDHWHDNAIPAILLKGRWFKSSPFLRVVFHEAWPLRDLLIRGWSAHDVGGCGHPTAVAAKYQPPPEVE
jgi:hypothetical protein